MSRGSKNPIKDEVVAAIHAHLAVHGSKNWSVLFERFEPRGIHKTTFWSWVKEVKTAAAASPALAAARTAIQTVVEGRETQLPEGVSGHLPATPSPNFISKTGARGLAQFDMILEIKKLYADAEMLRAYSVKEVKTEDGEAREHIKNPVAFDKSIARRASLLETSISAVQQIWNLRTMQSFYEVVVQEIGKADPDTQKRILVRLSELNQRTGMNLSAEF